MMERRRAVRNELLRAAGGAGGDGPGQATWRPADAAIQEYNP